MAALAKWSIILLTLSVAGSANARYPIYMTPLGQMYGEGFASQQQTDQQVGELSVEVICPSGAESDGMQRGARITLQNPGTNWDRPVMSRVLLNGMQKVWQECYFGEEEKNEGFVIGFMDVLASPVAGATPEVIFHVRQYQPIYKSWAYASSVAEENQKEVARQEAARTQEIQKQQAIEAWSRKKAADDAFWSEVWLWLKIGLGFAVALWLFSKREAILRWYYMSTPHPATSMVENAIQRGANIDGTALADALRVLPGGRIEQQVRMEQARRLTEMSRQHAERLRQEAEAIRAKAEKETEYIRANEALAKAAIEHEKAKARVEALRRSTR